MGDWGFYENAEGLRVYGEKSGFSWKNGDFHGF